MQGWIGVDLDGTLAQWDHWHEAGVIGKPIEPMVERVRQWLAEGKSVRIFTARADENEAGYKTNMIGIRLWCQDVFGQVLPITNKKDRWMTELWDDRCIQVGLNTGQPVVPYTERQRREPDRDMPH